MLILFIIKISTYMCFLLKYLCVFFSAPVFTHLGLNLQNLDKNKALPKLKQSTVAICVLVNVIVALNL